MTDNYGGYDEREHFAEFYDSIYEQLGPKDIDFFIDYSKKAGGPTLELGCGTGRVLIPTAIAGCRMTGLDLSLNMLRECRRKLEEQPAEVQERVKLVRGNMASFNTGEIYSLVTVPFRAFQLMIDTEQHKSCLAGVHRHLAEGGLLIIDVFQPRFARLIPDSKYTDEIEDLPEKRLTDGRTIRRTNRTIGFHPDLQYNEIEMAYYITHPDGKEERLVESLRMHYFFRYEMEHLLELSGFRIVDLFGDFERSAFTAESPEMIFVAEKKQDQAV